MIIIPLNSGRLINLGINFGTLPNTLEMGREAVGLWQSMEKGISPGFLRDKQPFVNTIPPIGQDHL